MNILAHGWAQEWFDEEGKQVEMSIDRVRFSSNQTVRCDGCGRIRQDLAFDEVSGLVIVKH